MHEIDKHIYIIIKMIWLFLVFEAFLEVVSSGTTQGWVHPIVLIQCSYQACSQSFNYQTTIIAILNHKLVKCVLDFLGCPFHHKRDVETWSCTNCTTCKGLFFLSLSLKFIAYALCRFSVMEEQFDAITHEFQVVV